MANNTVQKLIVSMFPKEVGSLTIRAIQNDTRSRQLIMTLVDQNNDPFIIPFNGKVVLYIKKLDGHEVFQQCVVTDSNVVSVILHKQAVVCVGDNLAQLYIYDPDSNNDIHSQMMILHVEKGITDNEDSTDVSSFYTILEEEYVRIRTDFDRRAAEFERVIPPNYDELVEMVEKVENDFDEFTDEVHDDLNGYVTPGAQRTYNLLEEKDLVALNARIDNIANLPEGSTTGDAELADIRVGADGKTYQSAGAAVRGQVSQLSESIVEIDKNSGDFFNKKVVRFISANMDINTGAVETTGSSYDKKRIVSDFVSLPSMATIVAKEPYVYYVVEFNNNKEFVKNNGGWTKEYTVLDSGYYRIMLRNKTNINGDISSEVSSVHDYVTFSSNQYPKTVDDFVNTYANIYASPNNIVRKINFEYELGGIDVNTGLNGIGTLAINRARSKQPVYIPKDFILKSLKGEYVFYLLKYNSYAVNDYSEIVASQVSSYEVTESGWYRVLIRPNTLSDLSTYIDDISERVVCLKKMKEYHVATDGSGDFNRLQSAIDFAPDSEDNPVTIVIHNGTYDRFSMVGFPLFIDRNYTVLSANRKRYISLIGTDKNNCIIRDDIGDYRTPPAEIRTYGIVKNLTFIATHDNSAGHDFPASEVRRRSYAIHMDFGEQDVAFEDCIMISHQAPAIGIGMYEGKHVTFKNCEMYSYANNDFGDLRDHGAVYCHSNPNDGITDQKISFFNCYMWSKYSNRGGAWIQKISDSECVLKSVNSVYYSEATVTRATNEGFELDVTSFGNNEPSFNA